MTIPKSLSIKITAAILAGTVAVGGCVAALRTAAAIRLERYLGTVSVLDAVQAPLTPREGLRLDDGKLFFNVTQPLVEHESFTIKTATMVTGIRGTCGWVEVIDGYTAQLTLLEGKVDTLTTDPATGEERTVTLTGGHTLTAVYYGDGQRAEEADGIAPLIQDGTIDENAIVYTDDGLRVETLKEEDVPQFVADEVAASQEIQDKIPENTDLSVPEILGRAGPQVLETTATTAPTVTQSTSAPTETVAETTQATGPNLRTFLQKVERTEYLEELHPEYSAILRYPAYFVDTYRITVDDATGQQLSKELISTTLVGEDRSLGEFYPIAQEPETPPPDAPEDEEPPEPEQDLEPEPEEPPLNQEDITVPDTDSGGLNGSEPDVSIEDLPGADTDTNSGNTNGSNDDASYEEDRVE